MDTEVEYRLLLLTFLLSLAMRLRKLGGGTTPSPPPCPIVRMGCGLGGMCGTFRRLPLLLCLAGGIFSPNEHSF